MHAAFRLRQRGGSTLAVVMLLMLVMTLTAAYLQRSLVFEQKTSLHQYRATQAAEAAEAGLEWGLAMLNASRVDERCMPQAAGVRLQERALILADVHEGGFVPAFDATKSGAPACRRDTTGWQCGCPLNGRSTPPEAPDNALHPGFRVEFSGVAGDDGKSLPSVVRLVAHGCAHVGAAFCADSAAAEPGHATVSVQAALVPALAAVPPAVLTAGGDVDFGGDPVGVHNADPGSALLVHAGGSFIAPSARLSPPAGTPVASALLEHDQLLAAHSVEQLMSTYLGMPLATFSHLPGVATLHCEAGCASALHSGLAAGVRMFYVTGDLSIDDDDIGTMAEPVALVVNGNARLGPGVRITGFLFARSLQWQAGSGGNAWLHGAAVVAGPALIGGAPDLTRDAEALNLLHVLTGTYTRVPGSWKDTL